MGKNKPLCVYCESRPAVTMDHAIPRSFFAVRPQNMITVPVCEECNKRKSLHEALVRDFLVTDFYGYEHPAAKALFAGKVKRSIQSNSSDFARSARTESYRVPVFDDKGVVLAQRTGVPVDAERVNLVLAMMVRGLLYHMQGQRIPQNYVFAVDQIRADKVEETAQFFMQLPHEGPYSRGDGVCEWVLVQAAGDPATTMWLLRFFHGMMFLVNTSKDEVV